MTDILRTCVQCEGTGTIDLYSAGSPSPSGSMECPRCLGSGKVAICEIDLSDMIDSIDDILDKLNDVKEKIDELGE